MESTNILGYWETPNFLILEGPLRLQRCPSTQQRPLIPACSCNCAGVTGLWWQAGLKPGFDGTRQAGAFGPLTALTNRFSSMSPASGLSSTIPGCSGRWGDHRPYRTRGLPTEKLPSHAILLVPGATVTALPPWGLLSPWGLPSPLTQAFA